MRILVPVEVENPTSGIRIKDKYINVSNWYINTKSWNFYWFLCNL